jgi:Undecaprenyl-phosphate galactose phosphotransferase WbaP
MVLILGDILAVLASGALAYLLWAKLRLDQPGDVYLALIPWLGLVPLAFATAGLYPALGTGPVELLRRLTTRLTLVFVLLASASFALQLPYVYSRVTFFLTWALSLVLVPLVRHLFTSTFGRTRWWPEPVVVVGEIGPAESVCRGLQASRASGFRAVAVLTGREEQPIRQLVGVPCYPLAEAGTLVGLGARVALVAAGDDLGTSKLVGWLQNTFHHVIVLYGGGGLPAERADARNLGGLLGIEFTNELLAQPNRVLKRSLDLVLGGVSLLLAAPLVALAACLVKATSRGPAFFLQEREGLHGRRFRLWKLRTMRANAQDLLESHLAADPDARRSWDEKFKLDHDPRVIPVVGTLLRRLSVDELPQLWNVVRGDMSLVGPRPFPDYHLERFSPAFRSLRSRVRPGLTGLWQVAVRSTGGLQQQEAYDSYYIRNWSVWMDLYVLVRTLGAVVSGRGAV